MRRQDLALNFIEPDRLTGGLDLEPATEGNIISQGIEFDEFTGAAEAYHILKPQYPGHYNCGQVRVPSEQIIHAFNVLRPGQLRGVTDFAPVILLADTMTDYVRAELDAAKMAAKWLGFVTSNDPMGFQETRIKPGEPDGKIEELENCIIEYLRENETMQLGQPTARPGDSFDRFARFVLRMLAITTDVPYEIVSGDYSGVNYSTSKASRNDYAMLLYPYQFWLERNIANRVFKCWLKFEALTQDYLRGYWHHRELVEKVAWIPAGMLSVDPLREGKADIDAVKSGLKSPQQVIMGHGGDPERVIKDISAWQEMTAKAGITIDTSGVSTSMANNPAKLGAVETLDDDEKEGLLGDE